MSCHVTLVVAFARNQVIGRAGTMPWHLPDDLRRFKSITMGHAIIMGRKTFESIGRPLPGRRSIIVSRRPDYAVPGAEVVGSLAEALDLVDDGTEAFVIGGGEIYVAALPLADRLLVTEIDLAPEGDTWFPEILPTHWKALSREEHVSPDGLRYAFVEYRRADPPDT